MPVSRIVISALAFAAVFVSGQSPAQAQPTSVMQFDVASIKPSDPGLTGTPGGSVSPGRFAARNLTVRNLLLIAYRLSNSQVGELPGWVETERFDIDAKSDYPSKTSDLPPMLQALLIDRFRLRAHKEIREVSAFELIVAKDGPKLREVGSAAIPNQTSSTAAGTLVGMGVSMRYLATALTSSVGRVVVDKTGLTGNYDVKLEWTPESMPALPPGTASREAWLQALPKAQQSLQRSANNWDWS
jgi:uncharacterized protein (TIGR03435 family)